MRSYELLGVSEFSGSVGKVTSPWEAIGAGLERPPLASSEAFQELGRVTPFQAFLA